ncbi:MAG: lipopolysaccharide biosynthesis protein [Sandaracinobacteroides sp.]
MTSRETLAARAAASVLWLMLGRWVQLAIALVTLAVMARFLGPEIYGAYSLAVLALAFADTLVLGTFSETLVQRDTIEERHKAAAFLVCMGIAVLLALALIPAAEPFAIAMRAPMIADVLPFMGLVILLLATSVVPAALLQREFRQRSMVVVEQTAGTVASIVGIALAIAGAGIWSLVALELVRAFLRSAGLLRQSGWRPSLRTDRAALGAVLHFGRSVVVVKLLTFTNRLVPRLAIGLALGPAAVGLFALAWRLYEQIQLMLVGPMTSLAMATVARAKEDLAFLRSLMVRASRASSFVTYPAFIGVAATAPVAIPLIFGAQWQGAVLPAQIFALIGMRGAISGFNGGLLRGLGRPDLQIRVSAFSTAFTIVVVPLVVSFGLAAVAAALLVRSFLTWPIGAHYVQRLIGLPAGLQARVGGEAALAALAMAAVLFMMQVFLAYLPPALLLVLMGATGAVVYLAAVAVIAPRMARGLLAAFRAVVRGDRAAAKAHLAEASRGHLPDDLVA